MTDIINAVSHILHQWPNHLLI